MRTVVLDKVDEEEEEAEDGGAVGEGEASGVKEAEVIIERIRIVEGLLAITGGFERTNLEDQVWMV
jgi:hypothetical protein